MIFLIIGTFKRVPLICEPTHIRGSLYWGPPMSGNHHIHKKKYLYIYIYIYTRIYTLWHNSLSSIRASQFQVAALPAVDYAAQAKAQVHLGLLEGFVFSCLGAYSGDQET